jgi:hypothetical protein
MKWIWVNTIRFDRIKGEYSQSAKVFLNIATVKYFAHNEKEKNYEIWFHGETYQDTLMITEEEFKRLPEF